MLFWRLTHLGPRRGAQFLRGLVLLLAIVKYLCMSALCIVCYCWWICLLSAHGGRIHSWQESDVGFCQITLDTCL